MLSVLAIECHGFEDLPEAHRSNQLCALRRNLQRARYYLRLARLGDQRCVRGCDQGRSEQVLDPDYY